jgi:hypothetical protein
MGFAGPRVQDPVPDRLGDDPLPLHRRPGMCYCAPVKYRPGVLPPTLLAVLLLATPSPTRAAPYDVDIEIFDETDIDQLYYDGDIDEDTRDRLMTMFLSKVDLNLATRDELYDLPGFTFEMADAVIAARTKRPFERVEELASVEGVTPEIYDQSLPFITVSTETGPKKWNAEVKIGAVGHTESDGPAFFLRGKTTFLGHAGAGFLLDVRPMIGAVHDAPPGGSFSASPERLRFGPDAFFAYWDGPRFAGILGSYRIGYGLRVTLDNTRKQVPHGWISSQDFTENNLTGHLTPIDGFLGAAVRVKRIDLGKGWLDLTAFGSASPRDIYYTDLYYSRSSGAPFLIDSATVDDPTPKSLFCDYPTLQNFMLEILGGGNATYFINQRSSVGFTGYGAKYHFLAEADGLRPGTSSRWPVDRSVWGAWGAFTKFGWGHYDFGLEATLTDKAKPGILAMAWIEPVKNVSIIPSFRYYDPDFDNPYARSEAEMDEFMGIRARDELGGRVKVNWKALSWLRLYTDLDVWWHKYPGLNCDPEEQDQDNPLYCESSVDTSMIHPTVDLSLIFRSIFFVTGKERITLWLNYRDRDLSKEGRDRSYAYYRTSTTDYSGGSKLAWSFQATTSRIPRVLVQAMFKQYLEDTPTLASTFDHSWYVWLRISAKLHPGPWLVARVKYYDQYTGSDPERGSTTCASWASNSEAITSYLPGPCRGESYVDAYLQASQNLPIRHLEGSMARLRVGWTHYTDDRSKWAKGGTCDPSLPPRNEFLVKGYLMMKF